ncbi:hypothetical protein B0T26DRAFT_715326 [Lasiosphaeria miniovina]|uniref:Uncharacterized protein n=1 Tax=Lasiosphaeria miniovina TaxID=1954250 RepID=A0AA40ABW1_9PEZI|nr:uncharacterized protein B0T26DRAFT_715326 [Lasiosphaeria miniovina]KAK0712813.1 hypothetical protein B0T26DRAFT_715326 [Lasiosphaeria miniovina]
MSFAFSFFILFSVNGIPPFYFRRVWASIIWKPVAFSWVYHVTNRCRWLFLADKRPGLVGEKTDGYTNGHTTKRRHESKRTMNGQRRR